MRQSLLNAGIVSADQPVAPGELMRRIKVRGQWTYLYRAVDKCGQTIEFRLSRTRDVSAAKAFFHKAIRYEGRPPQTITLDGYAASHRAVREMKNDGPLPGRTRLRSSKYLNNLIEQDHRGIKSRTDPMSPAIRRPSREFAPEPVSPARHSGAPFTSSAGQFARRFRIRASSARRGYAAQSRCCSPLPCER
jgi:hypothetical protein